MTSPKIPKAESAPVNPEIDPEAQAAADETARRAKERQQRGISAAKTILTSGDFEDLDETKVKQLG